MWLGLTQSVKGLGKNLTFLEEEMPSGWSCSFLGFLLACFSEEPLLIYAPREKAFSFQANVFACMYFVFIFLFSYSDSLSDPHFF